MKTLPKLPYIQNQDWCDIPVSVPWRSTGNYRDMQCWLLDNVHIMDWELDGADFANLDNRIIRFARSKDAIMIALRYS